MQITLHQRRTMANHYQDSLVARVVERLYRALPGRMSRLAPAEARALGGEALARLHAAGFSAEPQVAGLLEYVLAFGLNLAGERAREVLADRALNHRGKARRLGELALALDPHRRGAPR